MGLTKAQQRKKRNKKNRKILAKVKATGMTRREAREALELEGFRERYNNVGSNLGTLRNAIMDVVIRTRQVVGVMTKLKDIMINKPETLNMSDPVEIHLIQVDNELARVSEFETGTLRPLLAQWDELITTTDNVDKMLKEGELALSLQSAIMSLNNTMTDHNQMLERLSSLDDVLAEMAKDKSEAAAEAVAVATNTDPIDPSEVSEVSEEAVVDGAPVEETIDTSAPGTDIPVDDVTYEIMGDGEPKEGGYTIDHSEGSVTRTSDTPPAL